MNEEAFRFGPEQVLDGILTRGAPRAARKPAVLLLNAGLLHRVGPFRLYVELAREFAAQGHDVLRFDRSGVGESEARPGTLSEDDRARADIRDAIEETARRTGATEFILLGLCAGAYHAHMAAAVDPRVRGAVFLDGYAYRTQGFHVRERAAKYLDVARVGRFIKKKILSSEEGRTDAAPTPDYDIYETEAPPFDVFKSELEAMVARGTKLLFIFTGGVTYYNSDKQFREMLPDMDFKGCIETEYYPDVGHIYPVIADRERLKKRVFGWLGNHF